MLFFCGFFSCCIGVMAALSAYDHFSWDRAALALLLIALGLWLLWMGRQVASFGGDDDGPDLLDFSEAVGDAIDLFDD